MEDDPHLGAKGGKFKAPLKDIPHGGNRPGPDICDNFGTVGHGTVCRKENPPFESSETAVDSGKVINFFNLSVLIRVFS